MTQRQTLLPPGGIQACRPWPHALVSGAWRPALNDVLGGRPSLWVGERRFASLMPDGALLVDGGEESKSPGNLVDLVESLIRSGLTRDRVVVAVGGGATSDLVGFAAASALRGVDWIAVPTTLLAAVDASIGGKTGVNLGAGKNLLGAFHQPLATIIDAHFWQTLDRAELRSGVAEIFKTALLSPSLLTRILACSTIEDTLVLAPEVAATKLDVVAADPVEKGLRQVLNLGHTLGHALESQGAGRLRHGEAVAIGLAAVLRLAHPQAALIIAKLQALGLPTELPLWAQPGDLAERMMKDKKSTAQGLRIVVPQADGACELWLDVAPSLLLS
jgi:3-dehydroquinate synthetase